MAGGESTTPHFNLNSPRRPSRMWELLISEDPILKKETFVNISSSGVPILPTSQDAFRLRESPRVELERGGPPFGKKNTFPGQHFFDNFYRR